MIAFLAIIITTQVVFSYTAANQLCTADKLQECYDILNKNGLLSATILNFSEELMTEHCRRYKIFAECMRTTKPYCTEYGNTSYLAYQGLGDAFGFVCGKGFKEYVQYQASCYKDPNVQYESRTCRDAFLVRYSYLKANVTDKKVVRARYCQYIDDYIDCIYNLLLSFCGSPAAKWHKTFDTKSVEPTMLAFGCPEWNINSRDSTADNSAAIWVIALGAAIAVTGVMVAIGLVLVIYSRCRCRRRSSVRRSTSVDMPPPPYSGPPFTVTVAAAAAGREDEGSSTTSSSSSRRRSLSSSGSTDRTLDVRFPTAFSGSRSSSAAVSDDACGGGGGDGGRTRHDRASLVFEDVSEADGEEEEEEGAVGGSLSPFVRPYAPAGHFELPSPGSSILSYLQSSDDDTASLISHTCDYY